MIYTLRMRITNSVGQSTETVTLFSAQTEAELFELFSLFYDRAEIDARITVVESPPEGSPDTGETTEEPISLTDEAGGDRLDLFYRWQAETPI